MYNTSVYPTHVLHIELHVQYRYFYTNNTPKTPHMYYKCSTAGHVPLGHSTHHCPIIFNKNVQHADHVTT